MTDVPHRQRTARAIIFNAEGKLLLMERKKAGKHYFALPGGHVDDLESPEWAVVREVKEETGLDVTVAKLLYTGTDVLNNAQKIYLCNYHGGEPILPPDSQEAAIAAKTGQLYKPGWFAPEELRDKIVYPLGLLEHLELDILDDFKNNPRVIEESQ